MFTNMEMTLNVLHLHMYGLCARVVCYLAPTFVVYGPCAWVSLRVGMRLWTKTCTRTHLWAMTCDIISPKLTCGLELSAVSMYLLVLCVSVLCVSVIYVCVL